MNASPCATMVIELDRGLFLEIRSQACARVLPGGRKDEPDQAATEIGTPNTSNQMDKEVA